MVLSYFDKEGESPLILDNLSFRILKLEKRKDFVADTFINESGIYKINKSNKLKQVQSHSSKFQELLKKIKKEH